MAGRRFGMEVSSDRIEVWVRGDGLVLQEPAVAMWQRDSNRTPVIGHHALKMNADSAPGAPLVAPFGVFELSDPEAAEQIVRQIIVRVVGRLVFVRHELVLAVPAQLSTTARRLLLEVALASGARMAHLLDLPLALAFGAGLPVTSWEPIPVIFLLPASVQAAVVCHHGLLAHRALELTEIRSPGGAWATDEGIEAVVHLVGELAAEMPPAGAARLRAIGFHLAGRGVDLSSVSRQLAARTGMPARVVADPEHCVVKGAEVALERIEAAGGRTLLYLR